MKKIEQITRKTLLPALLCLVALAGVSCSNFLNQDPNHAAGESQNWNSYEDARANLMGVYGLMRSALAENDGHYLFGELRMGNFEVYNREELKAIRENRLDANYPMLNELSDWRRFYAAINAAAIFIERAPQIVEKDRIYPEETLRYDLAQVRALRAFAYFYMVRLWGDVPLVTYSYDNGSFPQMKRTPASTVLNYAKSELLACLEDLPYKFGTDDNRYYGTDESVWRGNLINKLGAYAILAHIAAWEGNYALVESYTTFIIDNALQGSAELLPTTELTKADGFFSNQTETNGSKLVGFGFAYEWFEATKTGHMENLTLAHPFVSKSYPDIYVSKETLHGLFDDLLDNRFGVDTVTHRYHTNYIFDMNSNTPVFSKFKVVRNASESGDIPIFGSSIVFSRLEDIHLLRAESLVAQNRGEEALLDYNTVRELRGLVPLLYKMHFQSDDRRLLDAIFRERQRELMGEGWNWYDQIRKEKLLGDNPELGALIRDGGIYWPVSPEVIKHNPSIVQNEYWK